MDFLPCACYPFRPAVSGGTGVYSSTAQSTPLCASTHLLSSIVEKWQTRLASPHFRACVMRAFEVHLRGNVWHWNSAFFFHLVWVTMSPRQTRSGIIPSWFQNVVSHYNEAVRFFFFPLWRRCGVPLTGLVLYSPYLRPVHNPHTSIPCERLSWFPLTTGHWCSTIMSLRRVWRLGGLNRFMLAAETEQVKSDIRCGLMLC